MLVSELDFLQVSQLVLLMLTAGLAAGFAAGLFGIGGGFVVVPVLLLVLTFFHVDGSIATHVAIGTSLATIVGTSLRSLYAHRQLGQVDFAVLRQWAPWLIAGVGVGLLFAQSLDGHALKLVFAIGVFLFGVHYVIPKGALRTPIAARMPSGWPLASIATFLGAFSALLGIGGGTIGVLVMTLCGREIHQAVATAAGFGVLIALPGAIGFAVLGLGHTGLPLGSFGYINVIAALSITAMSVITAPIGARVAHSLNAKSLQRIFGFYLIATSAVVFINAMTS